MSSAKFDFTGKVAFITGGASGIGEATADLFARSGAAIVVADLNQARGAAVCSAIAERGGRAVFVRLDVTDPRSVEDAVAAGMRKFGRMDFAVNSAGVSALPVGILQTDLSEWRRVLSINLDGLFLCLKAELAVMKRQGYGSVVNMSSAAGIDAGPTMAAYTSSKHAVLGLTKTAALEFAGSNIRVNSICPTAVDTPMVAAVPYTPAERKAMEAMHPMGRIARPDEVATMIAFACSDASSYSTGVEFRINGGTGL
ncbi:MAG: SDR family NAD(P)-dependent oxidoreductase [Casimicrobiaceae bacterium]